MTTTHARRRLRWVAAGHEPVPRRRRRAGRRGVRRARRPARLDRAHLVAHVAANADALGNLAQLGRHRRGDADVRLPRAARRRASRRAATHAGRRAAHLVGASRPPASAGTCDGLTAGAVGRARSGTAQGRTVPATEIPWLRAREVCVHAVDLADRRHLRRPARRTSWLRSAPDIAHQARRRRPRRVGATARRPRRLARRPLDIRRHRRRRRPRARAACLALRSAHDHPSPRLPRRPRRRRRHRRPVRRRRPDPQGPARPRARAGRRVRRGRRRPPDRAELHPHPRRLRPARRGRSRSACCRRAW